MSDNKYDPLQKDYKNHISNKITNLKNNLDTIVFLSKDVESFTCKQYELFEILNKKFPNIGQFSNALEESTQLNATIENLQNISSICKEELDTIEELFKSDKEKEAGSNDVRDILIKLFLHSNELSSNPNIIEELKKLLHKLG